VTKEKVDCFRKEAAEARSLAATAMTEEIRRGYLQLARDWETMADDAQAGLNLARTGQYWH